MPAALSAANEVAVQAFVAGRILFGEIAEVVSDVLAQTPDELADLENVRRSDSRARDLARNSVEARSAAAAK